jgi:hypothetical protein
MDTLVSSSCSSVPASVQTGVGVIRRVEVGSGREGMVAVTSTGEGLGVPPTGFEQDVAPRIKRKRITKIL